MGHQGDGLSCKALQGSNNNRFSNNSNSSSNWVMSVLAVMKQSCRSNSRLQSACVYLMGVGQQAWVLD